MIVGDLLLEKEVDPEALRMGLASAFDVDREQVMIVDSIEDVSSLSGIVGQVGRLEGQFVQQVSVYVAESMPLLELEQVATTLAREVGSSVLIPEDSPDPYKMTLIDSMGRTETVQLDVKKLDELGEYEVASREKQS